MASTKLNGTSIGIYYGTQILGAATSHTLSIQSETADVTTKDSAGWREILPTLKSWSISVEALMTYDETYGATELRAALTARTQLNFKFQTGASGDDNYYGNGYITSFEINAPMEDAVTYSATFEGTGAIAVATTT